MEFWWKERAGTFRCNKEKMKELWLNEWMSDELNNNADCCWYIHSSWQSKSFEIDELNYLYTKREFGESGEEATYLYTHFYSTLIHTPNEFLETKVSLEFLPRNASATPKRIWKKNICLMVLENKFNSWCITRSFRNRSLFTCINHPEILA